MKPLIQNLVAQFDGTNVTWTTDDQLHLDRIRLSGRPHCECGVPLDLVAELAAFQRCASGCQSGSALSARAA